MKANELMIGDWVRLQYNHFITEELVTKDFQVIEIHDGAKTNYIWGKDGNMGIVEHIQPIPLTKEILEKNGFAVHRQFATFTEYWLDIPQKWVRVAPNSYIEIYNGENKNVHIEGKVYVHEFQHALRLCGIDKEIVL